MIDLIKNYLDNIFSNLPETKEVLDAKQDLFLNMEEKFIELKNEGKSDSDAFAIVISEFGNVEEILEDIEHIQEDSKKTLNKEDSIFFEVEENYEEDDNTFKETKECCNKENKLSKLLWGAFLIALALSGLFSLIFGRGFNMFFDGWWTMFLIIPGLIGIATKENKQWSYFLLVIGIILLIQSTSYLDFDWLWPVAIIISLLVIGFKMLLYDKSIFNKDARKYDNSIDISDEIVAIFGGIEVLVPKDVNVVAKGQAIFGGVDYKSSVPDAKYTLYVDYICAFGGIDIK
ncbi:MAG: permease prefix domain 1-containing protein [Bacilli bacterium]